MTQGALALATTRHPERVQIPFPDGLLTLQNSVAVFTPMSIVAAGDTFAGLAILTLDSAGRRLIAMVGAGSVAPVMLDGIGPLDGLFGQGPGKYPRPYPLLATSALSSEWTMHNFDHQSQVVVPGGSTVMAVTGRFFLPAGLLVRSADGHTLSHVSQFGTRILIESAAEIVNVAVDLATLRIAWLDAAGGLGVMGVEQSRRILYGTPAEDSPHCRFTLVPE